MIRMYDQYDILTRFGLMMKICAAAVAINASLKFIAFNTYFLLGSVIMCETHCSPAQHWLQLGLAISPLMLIVSVIFGCISVFYRASFFKLAVNLGSSGFVMVIQIIDGM